jgi:hypothetical protein
MLATDLCSGIWRGAGRKVVKRGLAEMMPGVEWDFGM